MNAPIRFLLSDAEQRQAERTTPDSRIWRRADCHRERQAAMYAPDDETRALCGPCAREAVGWRERRSQP